MRIVLTAVEHDMAKMYAERNGCDVATAVREALAAIKTADEPKPFDELLDLADHIRRTK
jgi:hypothetical protein